MKEMKAVAEGFLTHKRVAVTGVSRSAKNHGSNLVYKRLRERGYEVFAANPNTDQVEGDACYSDLRSIPDGVDWVVIGTRPKQRRGQSTSAPKSVLAGGGCTAPSETGACHLTAWNLVVSMELPSLRRLSMHVWPHC